MERYYLNHLVGRIDRLTLSVFGELQSHLYFSVGQGIVKKKLSKYSLLFYHRPGCTPSLSYFVANLE